MLHSPACERNREPILAVLVDWLPSAARVLEIGSGSGQHAAFFCERIAGLHWQPTERSEGLEDLRTNLAALDPALLAHGATLAPPLALDVAFAEPWPAAPCSAGTRSDGTWDAVFTANTCHILPESALPLLLAGSRRALRPGGLLLLYGPFHDNGVPTAASNAAFDAHLRSLDPAMGVRDAVALQEQARGLGLAPLADVAMPANNRMLILRVEG